MRSLFTIIFLCAAVLLGSVGSSYGQNESILDKQSAVEMFALSSSEWKANLVKLQITGIGEAFRNTDGTFTLIYRPDPRRGILSVTPSYSPNRESRPFKIDVTVIADQPSDWRVYESISFADIKSILEDTANSMRPEFTVMGYLVRDGKNPPMINFTIFQQGEFPPIDVLVNEGKVCPPRDGEQNCILESQLSAPKDEALVLDRCVSQLKNSPTGVGRTETGLRDMCLCVSKMGKAGKSFEHSTAKCIK